MRMSIFYADAPRMRIIGISLDKNDPEKKNSFGKVSLHIFIEALSIILDYVRLVQSK